MLRQAIWNKNTGLKLSKVNILSLKIRFELLISILKI